MTREIDWSSCPDAPDVDCATLELPVDWAQPDGETFELAIVRRPARDPDRRIGPLLLNPGGPGGSGVDFAINADGYFSQEVVERFDLIGFDPRGIARSNPVVCSSEAANAPGFTELPTSQDEFDALLAYNRQLYEDCKEHTGPLIDHVDSANVARDVEAIREALGEETINWFGVSYGTLMGQMYAELYPDRVRSMVLDSNMDHSLGTTGFLLTEAWGVQDAFNEFAAWCDRSEECALHGEDVSAVWRDLLERADAGELVDPDSGRPVTSSELISTASSSFYGPGWDFLADLIDYLRSGGESAAKASTLTSLQANDLQRFEAAPAQDDLLQFPMAAFCEDWKLPIADQQELDRQLRLSNQVAPDMRASPLAMSATMSCLGWPSEQDNPQHRLDVEGAPTLLLTNAYHDPATPYLWALNADLQLGKASSLLPYEGWGHAVYDRSDCTRNAIDAYLLDQTVPPKGTSCEAVQPEVSTLRTTGDTTVPGSVPGRW